MSIMCFYVKFEDNSCSVGYIVNMKAKYSNRSVGKNIRH